MAEHFRGDRPAGMPSPIGERNPSGLDETTAAWQETSEALHDAQRRYRELVEYSLGLICTHDLNGNILSINPAAANSLGYQPEEGIGRNLREFLSEQTRHLFDEYLRRLQQQGRDEGLMRVNARTGASRVWMYRNVLSHGPDRTAYVLGHAIDITERVDAERTLRENERALWSAHADLEARVAERTVALERVNERLRREIADREEAERSRARTLIEQRDTLAFLSTFSDHLAPVVTFNELIDVVRRAVVPFLADWTIVHLVNDEGAVRSVLDPRADRAPEPLDATVADTVSGPLAADSALGRAIATGRLAIISSNSGDLATRLVGPAAAATAFRQLESGTATLLPLVVDGRVAAVVTLVSHVADRVSPPDALVIEDIARRIRLAVDRIQLYREAQEANRLKDEFLTTLSHELRTPLNAIFGWARILRTRDLDNATVHAVKVIERNAEAQVRLIDEVLDVSRIITGKMNLAMDSVHVPSIVHATIDTVRPAMQAKRIRFEERIEEVPPVFADAHRLQQVFWNLLSNALKFTGNDGVITVTLRRADDSVEFEITDTGVGIGRDVLPFVFDRFRQADSSMTRTHGGLGLGLAIVRHIVELHGGSVRAASAGEGTGATFTIRLPTGGRHPAPALALSPGGATDDALLPSLLANRVILVVEDHDDAREMIAGVFEAAGARVLSASTTMEAVERVAQVKPDALVADLGLPGEDGYELLNRLRARYPDLPAIALTAYARSTDRDRALAAGFQHHIIKPMDPHALVRVVVSML
jgi:PAS domain S-box-containing protein